MNIDNIQISNKHIFLLRGISGSGKSTFIEKFKKAFPDKNITVVSADHFFYTPDGQYNFDRNKLAVAHGTCKGKFEKALQANNPIVFVDNTNLKYQEMKPYIEMAEAAGYNWNIIQIETPLSVVLERQKSCKNLDEGVVLKMVEKMKSATFSLEVKNKTLFINGNENK
jgi:predicted kinase